MDYSKYMSDAASQFTISVLSQHRLRTFPANMLSLSGGVPNPSLFPFLDASFTLRDGSTLSLDPEIMAFCLQYSRKPGYEPLKEQLEELTKSFHAPPRMSERDIVVTYGAQQGILMSCEVLLNPGDYVVVEEPSYCSIFPILRRYGARILSIQCDSQGMDPILLRKALAKTTDGVVKMMYLNPSGANPTGLCMDETRRRDIYNIACENDFIILEDDPYYFIQFTEKIPPSFLSLDIEGRVLRVDSFSKILAPGLRVGYVTAPKLYVENMKMTILVTCSHCTTLPQVMICELLRKWGREGFLEQVTKVSQLCRTGRDDLLEAADRHLSGLCEWTAPAGGMFLWIKVLGVKDTRRLVMERGMKRDVLFLPGFDFMEDKQQACPYIRVSYSFATAEQMDKAFRILAEIIEDEKRDSKTL